MYNIRKFVTYIHKELTYNTFDIYVNKLHYIIYNQTHSYMRIKYTAVDDTELVIEDSTISKCKEYNKKEWNLLNNTLTIEYDQLMIIINDNSIRIEFDIYAIVKMIEDKVLTF